MYLGEVSFYEVVFKSEVHQRQCQQLQVCLCPSWDAPNCRGRHLRDLLLVNKQSATGKKSDI